MRGYELMYILDPTLDEDATQALVGQVEDFMSKQGVALEKTEPWGKRRLAYPIGKHWEGYYVLSHFQAGSGVVTELERRLRVMDGVMRFLTVRVDEEQEKRERRAKKQAAAVPETESPEASAGESEAQAAGDGVAASPVKEDEPTDTDTAGGQETSTDEEEKSEPGEAS